MSKINEIFAFTKLISKTTESIFEDMCEILQNLTFYSESQKISKDIFIIYTNSIRLFSISLENYINLYKNVDINLDSKETQGIIYNSFYLSNSKKFNQNMKNKLDLKKLSNYNKIKLINFDTNNYCNYIESFPNNSYSIALLYGDNEYVFKRLEESNTVSQAINILNHNIDILSEFNNNIKIELIKFNKLIKINKKIKLDKNIATFKDVNEIELFSISEYDSFSDLSED